MAVKDESLHRATEDLILPKPRKYYQTLIYNSHWQLRSLVASPEPNILYFPSGHDIIALNTKTRERETISTITFAPRCLAASKDWICVGGDDGDYATISLKEKRLASDLSVSLDFDADARLPLEFDLAPSHRASLRESLRRTRTQNQTVAAKVTKVGREIVNCITTWSPNAESSEHAYSSSLSIIANNDCSVTIMDIEKSEAIQRLTFPDYVNRSVMSPSGVLLATISDDPYLYIHLKRNPQKSRREPWRPGSEASTDNDWKLLCRVQIEGQRPSEQSEMRGSFAACFSRTGRYLAVATQYGVISIFDVNSITEKESLRAVLSTSRPSSERDCGGAARDMEFCPGPFDLLAWTESTGRVGIADMRTLFFSKQLIILSSDDESIERIATTDKSRRDPAIDPRLRSFQTETTRSSSTPDYLGLDMDRRQVRHISRELENRQQVPLTVEELEVLQAHRIARRQRDNAAIAAQAIDDATNVARWVRMNTESNGTRTSSSNLPAALRDFVNIERGGTPSFRNFINERNQDRERRNQLQQVPRRRSSIMLYPGNQSLEREREDQAGTGTESGTTRNGNEAVSSLLRYDQPPSLERLSLTQRQASNTDSLNNTWPELEVLYRTRLAGEQPPEHSTRLRIELEDDDRRDFAHRLRQPWRFLGDETAVITQEPRVVSSTAARPGMVETMGLCWSTDGRILYVGASNGIYEYHVNVAGRMMFPDLMLR